MLILNVYFVEIDCLIFGQLESRLMKQTEFENFQRPTLYDKAKYLAL